MGLNKFRGQRAVKTAGCDQSFSNFSDLEHQKHLHRQGCHSYEILALN